MAGCNGGGFSSTNAVTDFTLPDGKGQEFTLSDELQDHEAAVLVFYQSYTWSFCVKQLGELAEDYELYSDNGVEIIGLAVQAESSAASMARISKATFPILADADHVVAEDFGVYDLFDDGEAGASVFIINKEGEIVWESIAEKVSYRVSSATILENLP